MHSMLITKQYYKLSRVKQSRPFIGKCLGIMAGWAIASIVHKNIGSHISNNNKHLYNQIVTIGNKDCSNAHIKKEECKNPFCCKYFYLFRPDDVIQQTTHKKKFEFFNNIPNKYIFLGHIKASLKALEDKEKEARVFLIENEMNVNEYKAIVELIEHKKACHYKELSFFEEYKDDYYEQQKRLYVKKLQKKQQELRDLATAYESRWLIEKEGMEELIQQLCTMKSKASVRGDQAAELHLYDRSLPLLSNEVTIEKSKENFQNKE
jgi:hypothetical protein